MIIQQNFGALIICKTSLLMKGITMFKKVFICCTLVLSANALFSMEKEKSLYEQFQYVTTYEERYQKWYPEELPSLLKNSDIEKEFTRVVQLLKQYDLHIKNLNVEPPVQSNFEIKDLKSAFEELIKVLTKYANKSESENDLGGICDVSGDWDYPEYGPTANELLNRVKRFYEYQHINELTLDPELQDFLHQKKNTRSEN